MQQLSGLDAIFLYLETAEMPMHVGALHVFELPAGLKGRFVTALREHVAQRLADAPVLRRRLWWPPLNLANPAWVDADPDLKQHIVEHKLPPSARLGDGRRELQDAVAQLHLQALDRSRPLWKFHVLEGLAPAAGGARRVGLYTQLHHAAVDGQAAVALANALLDLYPEGRASTATAPGRRTRPPVPYEPGMTEMLRGVLGSQAQKMASIIRELPATVGTLKSAAGQAAGAALEQASGKLFSRLGLPGAAGRPGGGPLGLAPRTRLNVSVGSTRAFATASLPLGELKTLARAHGATVNDLVLMLCGSALRRWFQKRRALPKQSLVAAVPVSLRGGREGRVAPAAGEGNLASLSLVSLGTHLADPLQRLAHVQAAGQAMKSAMGPLKSVLPVDFPSLGLPWLLEAATALYGRARLADRLPQLANLVISNVPGPSQPLYLAGARMQSNWPASIVVHGLALNITVQSYADSLDFGLMADGAALPEVQELADALQVAFDDLAALPRPGEAGHPATVPPRSLARRASGAMVDAVTGAVGGAVSSAVGSAVTAAMAGAVTRAVGSGLRGLKVAPAPPARGRRSGSESPSKARAAKKGGA
jgi:WS/DGAT/MGAT family acyltransferase